MTGRAIVRCGLTWVVGVFLATAAPAQVVVNGDMDGAANFQSYNAVTPAGWTAQVFGGTDLFDSSTTVSGMTWQPSSSGGTFVHGAANQAGME